MSAPDRRAVESALTAWFAHHGRDFPWRRAQRTPWGVLVSEVMAQQTPMSRVEPAWRAWIAAWPTPRDAASASAAEVVRAWGRLGYPRRALRLREAAAEIDADPRLSALFLLPASEAHDASGPDLIERLRALPGVGEYTAGAVTSFAFGRRAVVLDTNVRRVLARVFRGEDQPAGAVTNSEREAAAALLPSAEAAAVAWTVAVMELGALVCRAAAPRCETCPVSRACAWRRAGSPRRVRPLRRQAWAGTTRQARGRILAVLREEPSATRERLLREARVSDDPEQPGRALESLVSDGLVEEAGGVFRLPS